MNPGSIILAISFWAHFVGISIWVGASLIMPFVIQPAMISLDPPSRMKPMAAIAGKMAPFIGLSIGLTFISGIVQTAIIFGSNVPLIMIIKIVLALLMMVNGIYVGVVLTRRVGKLAPAPGTPPAPEFLKAQRLLVMHGWIQAGLAVVISLVVGFLRVGVR